MGVNVSRVSLIPSVLVFLLKDDRVLLQRRVNTGYRDGWWASGVAGHIEPGEGPFDAALRESLEETGVRIDRNSLVPVTVMHLTDGGFDANEQRVNWYFVCRTWTGIPRVMEPEKCAELSWFPISDLPNDLIPDEKFALTLFCRNELPVFSEFFIE